MNKLRELRLHQNLTTPELGKRIKLDPSMITHIEKGDKSFSMESLKRACEYFRVSADYLLGADPEQLLKDFVSSIERDFYRHGEFTQGAFEGVAKPLATKLDVIIVISSLTSQDALDAVYACARREQAKEEFAE